MKLNLPKDWFLKHVPLEEGSIAAGSPHHVVGPCESIGITSERELCKRDVCMASIQPCGSYRAGKKGKAVSMTLDFGTCTIIVRLFNRRDARHTDWSYAVFISRLTGETLRMTIPELIKSLQLAAKPMRKRGGK